MGDHSQIFLEKTVLNDESYGICIGKKARHPDWMDCRVPTLAFCRSLDFFLHRLALLGVDRLVFSYSQGLFEVKHLV